MPDDNADIRDMTLRLDIDSVTVHHVGSVTYGTDSHPVARHRSEKRNPKF
jgi:hypothetical protein